jgi:hypothetical protein
MYMCNMHYSFVAELYSKNYLSFVKINWIYFENLLIINILFIIK